MTFRTRFQRGFTLLELLLVLALVGVLLSIGLPLLDRSLSRAQFKSGVVKLQTELQHTRLLAMKTGNVHVFRFLPGTGSYEVLTRDAFTKRMEQAAGHTPFAGSLTAAPGAPDSLLSPFDSAPMLGDGITKTEMVLDGTGSELAVPLTNSSVSPSSVSAKHTEESPNIENHDPQASGHRSLAGNLVSDIEATNENTIRQTSGNVVFRLDHVSDAPRIKPQGVSAFVDGEVEVDLGSRMIGSLTELPQEERTVDIWSKPILFYPNGRTSQAIIQLESSDKYPLYSEIVLRGLTGSPRVTAISAYPPGSPQFPTSMPSNPETRSDSVEQESYVP